MPVMGAFSGEHNLTRRRHRFSLRFEENSRKTDMNYEGAQMSSTTSQCVIGVHGRTQNESRAPGMRVSKPRTTFLFELASFPSRIPSSSEEYPIENQ